MRSLLHRESIWIPIVLITILIGCWSELDLYAPSFPQMLDYFKTTDQMMQWTLSLNFLGFFFASLLCGPLADAYGRRPVIIGGSILFLIGSLICVASMNIETMLLGRFFQGLGVSAPVTVSMAVIADIYQGERQVSLLSKMNTSVTIVMALAPVIGVYLTEMFGWRANFLAIFIIALLGSLLIWLFVPETHADDSRVDFSPRSLITSYLTLLKSRKFMGATLALCLMITPYFIFIGIVPLLFQKKLGISLDEYKYYQGSVVAVFAALSLFIPAILRRFNGNKLLRLSFVCSTVAMVASFVLSIMVPDNALAITALMWVFTAGIVLPPTLMFAEAMDMHPELRACSSSMIQSVRMLFMAIGTALAGTFYDGRYLYAVAVMLVFMLASLPFAISVLGRREKEGTKNDVAVTAMH
jgi:DHA1 family bicyclomycin/chloramphenicol resistance-like MFS transporter